MKTNLQKKPLTEVKPDAKGRIFLGKLAEGVNAYKLYLEPDGCIILEPYVLIPAKESWLFDNKKAHASLRRGLAQSAKDQTKALGSFAKYAEKE